MIKRVFLLLLQSMAIMLLAAGCCPPALIEAGRRPQVMTGAETSVLDYNPALEMFSQELAEAEDEKPFEKIPLTPEMHQPYYPDPDTFKLEIGDTLAISIYDEEDTEAEEVAVAPDGKIYYSFFDAIPATGRTVPEVTKSLEEAAKRYFVNPIVSVNPKSFISQTYKILGRVQKPGVYTTVDPMRLREAIGEAGGFLLEDFSNRNDNSPEESLADLAHSFIQRKGEKLDVNFHDLVYNPSSDQDIYVQPGDYIYIAATPFRQVFVLGGVLSPTRLRYLRGMRLTEALASAGGWLFNDPYGADISKVLVIRGCLECPLYVKVDMHQIFNGEARDIVLAPGDIIYVYNKSMRFGRQLVRLAINTFIQAFATSAAGYYGQFEWFKISAGADDGD